MDSVPQPRSTRIIALMNQKGGVGKTTTTANLGAALTRLGCSVLLIDLDPQGHLSLHVGVDPSTLEHTLYDLLTTEHVSALEVLQRVNEKLAILPGEVSLAGVEAELSPRVASGEAQRILKAKCDVLLHPTSPESSEAALGLFDYVLIDCPPSLGLLTINALTLAQEVIVPMQAQFLALQGLSKLLETVTLVRQAFNPSLRVSGVVLCMHEGQTLLAQEVLADLRQFVESGRNQDVAWRDAVVYDPPIRRNIKLAECPSFGKTIFDYAPQSHGAGDYQLLAQSLIQQRV